MKTFWAINFFFPSFFSHFIPSHFLFPFISFPTSTSCLFHYVFLSLLYFHSYLVPSVSTYCTISKSFFHLHNTKNLLLLYLGSKKCSLPVSVLPFPPHHTMASSWFSWCGWTEMSVCFVTKNVHVVAICSLSLLVFIKLLFLHVKRTDRQDMEVLATRISAFYSDDYQCGSSSDSYTLSACFTASSINSIRQLRRWWGNALKTICP